MRFISQYSGYGAQIRAQRQEGRGDGTVQILTPGLYVTFKSLNNGGFVYENEQVAALKHFEFRGNTQDRGEAVPTDPLNRLSVCDTQEWQKEEGWSDEERELVERRLLEISETTPEEVLYIASTPLAAPFPNYDTYEGDYEALVVKLIEDGHDLERVLEYEKIFGRKREELILMLEEGLRARDAVTVRA